jgi:YHS domain-containing protein
VIWRRSRRRGNATGSASSRLDQNGEVFAIRNVTTKAKLEAEESMARDPVCGMSVEEVSGTSQTQFEGKKYYFCSDECKNEFEAERDGYVEAVAA